MSTVLRSLRNLRKAGIKVFPISKSSKRAHTDNDAGCPPPDAGMYRHATTISTSALYASVYPRLCAPGDTEEEIMEDQGLTAV